MDMRFQQLAAMGLHTGKVMVGKMAAGAPKALEVAEGMGKVEGVLHYEQRVVVVEAAAHS